MERHCVGILGSVFNTRVGTTLIQKVGSASGTILVVEDDVLIRLRICEDLASEGYEVLTAARADEAIKILESRDDITTVFTDIHMPGSMDGLKLAAAVRDRWPPVNIVITSGRVRPRADEMPTDSVFLGKPYQTAHVVKALRTFGN